MTATVAPGAQFWRDLDPTGRENLLEEARLRGAVPRGEVDTTSEFIPDFYDASGNLVDFLGRPEGDWEHTQGGGTRITVDDGRITYGLFVGLAAGLVLLTMIGGK